MAKVAVVILNYNGRDYLQKFLPPLLEHSSSAEIVVADNASTDDSVSFLEKNYPAIRLIELEDNHGYAGGYNLALEKVEAEYFVLLNSDIEVSANWLDPLVEFLDGNPDYAACQPKILDFNRKDHFEYAGASGGFVDAMGYPFCRGRILNHLEEDKGQYNDPLDISWATGACMMIRAEVFKAFGGFDSDFFAHMEEIDLCWRIKSQGAGIRCVPGSVVYHVGGGTLSKSHPNKTYFNFRNGLFLILKNMPMGSLIWKLPFRLILDWTAAFSYLLTGKLKHSFAVFRAHASFIGKFRSVYRKRGNTGSGFTERYSILTNYYFGGKRRFSDYQ